MKKKNIIITITCVLILIVILIVSVLVYNKNLNTKRISEMQEAATKYYDNYMSTLKGIDNAEVTLGMINKVIKEKNAKYDIKSLKKCSDDTKADLKISLGKVKNIEISLNCK